MTKSRKMRKLIKSANMGKPDAMYNLGLCYELGRERPMNMQLASEWMLAAARKGYAPATEWIKDYSFDDDANVAAHS